MTLRQHSFTKNSFGCDPECLPFPVAIGLLGPFATFGTPNEALSLDEDLSFLLSLKLDTCYYGAIVDSPVIPFFCDFHDRSGRALASDILSSLHASTFSSDHIPDLDKESIHFPGYKPGANNDEIHVDSCNQHIFANPGDETAALPDEGSRTHERLKNFVVDHKLWYVLIHTKPFDYDHGEPICDRVFLFAVGRSPHARRLIGVVTTQACHNLCD